VSAPFEPLDKEARQEYIGEVLAERSFDYEADPMPTLDELEAYFPAYEKLEGKRESIGFESDTTVLIPLVDDACLELSMNGEGYDVVHDVDTDDYDGWVKMDVDPRLLRRLSRGPTAPTGRTRRSAPTSASARSPTSTSAVSTTASARSTPRGTT